MQNVYGQQSSGGDGDMSIEQFFSNVKKMIQLPTLTEFASAVTRLTQSAVEINKTFLQGRQRIVELQQSVADAVPNVLRLGGELRDVTDIISNVAKASNRNVVATTEQVEKLYAAEKVLGQGAETLTNSFLDVGMSVQSIGKSLEDSIKYIQSIGGNSKEVVEIMRRNMDQLNRYQFEGGVQGLTKMAAQASMLRFSMNETFTLAEKVLSPENAIEVASSFQRLGVTAGNLVDPFQLMNQSINDPSGLQTSLSEVAKQFTYFDEKTKSFRISPQGVLTLKELEQQTGVSAREMSKMGLAAAELDKRLSAVRSAGLTIASEEDKQYLANIATMTEKGTYEVTLKDGTKKELQQLNQKEFDELIKEQKEGPKTLEEIARSQMNVSQTMQADISAIRAKVVGGAATATPILTNLEGGRKIVDLLGQEFSKMGTTRGVREMVEGTMTGIQDFMRDLSDPKKDKMGVLQQYADKVSTELKKIGGDLDKKFLEAIEKVEGRLSTSNLVERKGKQVLGSFYRETPEPVTKKTTPAPISVDKTGKAESATRTSSETYGTTVTSKVDIGGGFKLDVNFNGAEKLSAGQLQQIEKILYDWVRSPETQGLIYNVTKKQNPTKGA